MTKPSAGVRLFKEGGLYTLGLFVLRTGNFLLLPLYTGLLSTAQYGAVGVVEMLVALVVIFAMMAQTHSLLRLGVDVEGDETARRQLLSSVVTWTVGAGVVLTAVAALAWPLYGPRLGGIELWPVGLAGLAGVAGTSVFRVSLSWLQFARRAQEHTALLIQRWLLLLAFVLFFLLVLGWRAEGILLAQALSFTCGAALALRKLPEGRDFRIHLPTLKASLIYGLPIVPHVLSGVIFQATDRALLAAHSGLDEAGVYTLAAKLASAVFMVAMGAQRAWLPFFLREDRDAGQKGWGRVRKLSFFSVSVVACVAVGVALFSPEVVDLFAPGAYAGASEVVPILALAAFLRAYYLIAVSPVMADKKTARLIALATLPAAALNVVLNAWWIPDHGMVGAAWATFTSHAASLMLTSVLSRRARKVPFKFVKAALLLVLVASAMHFGVGASLLARFALALGFGGALLLLDGRDILAAARSVWRRRQGTEDSSGDTPSSDGASV